MATGGGLKAIKSVFRYASQIGPLRLIETLRSRNACKACAFGTGGQKGGIRNETGHGIEFCNKNIQAHLSDVRPGIPNHFFFERSIKELAQLKDKALEDIGRLTTPLYKKAGDTHFSPITYDEALSHTARAFNNSAPENTFFYASGRSSNEAAFSLQLLARLYGTNNINNCSYYCHQASGEGLTSTIGTSTATVEYDDLSRADTIVVLGANPASNHPRFVKCLLQCRRRGGNVIIINPAKELGLMRFASPSDWRSMLKGGESVASHYIQPHAGGDTALLHGLSKALIESDAVDTDFIKQYTEGYDTFYKNVSQLDWHTIVENSGVSREEIETTAKILANSNNTIFAWGMGLTHHLHGVKNIETLSSLALLRGMVGKPGAGLLPLRGHSNIQGTGSMGFTPRLKQAVEKNIEQKLHAHLPKTEGKDTLACIHAAHNHNMSASIMLGGNLLAASPNTHYSEEALNRIPFKAFITSTINRSHVQGVDQEVVIFPIRVRDEEAQATTQESMFNFVRLSDGGIDRFPQLRSELDIICDLGARLISTDLLDFNLFRDHATVRSWVGDVISGYPKISQIDNTKEEFHIDGRIHHAPVFNTPDGKAHFAWHTQPARGPSRENHGYILSTIRSEGQFNSIIFDEHDTYRGQTSRNVVLMNPDDIKADGLKAGDTINLHNDTGQLSGLTVVPYDVRAGNLLTYYPEANVLIGAEGDTRSQTPAFKSTPVILSLA